MERKPDKGNHRRLSFDAFWVDRKRKPLNTENAFRLIFQKNRASCGAFMDYAQSIVENHSPDEAEALLGLAGSEHVVALFDADPNAFHEMNCAALPGMKGPGVRA